MTAKVHHYLVVTRSGRPWLGGSVSPGLTSTDDPEATYWSILQKIFTEYQSAGSQWDRPWVLMLDGRIVVEGELSEVAWDYCTKLREAEKLIRQSVRDGHMPDWLARLGD